MENLTLAYVASTAIGEVTTLDLVPLTPYWPMTFRVIMSTILCVLMVFAVFGNLLVVMVIAKHSGMQTRTNLFLCNLALADILCGVLDMPVTLVTLVAGRWVFPAWLCQINGFTLPFLFVTSIHTLMYISVHKYISISRPFSLFLTKTRVVWMIGAAWLWAALTGVYYKPYTTQCGPEYPHDKMTYIHMIFIMVTGYFLPLLIMIFCFVGIFIELRAHASRMARHTTMRKEDIYSQQRRITSTLLAVLLVFVFSWVPFLVYSFYMAIKHRNNMDPIPIYANPFSYICVYVNRAFNSLIYAKGSTAFRDGYKEILLFWQNRKFEEDESGSFAAFSRFRTYVRETLYATFHSSSDVNSARSSIVNLTNHVLYNKPRALSTCSLPQNFYYSTAAGSIPRRRYRKRKRKRSDLYRFAHWLKERFSAVGDDDLEFPPPVQASLLRAPVGFCARQEVVNIWSDTYQDESTISCSPSVGRRYLEVTPKVPSSEEISQDASLCVTEEEVLPADTHAARTSCPVPHDYTCDLSSPGQISASLSDLTSHGVDRNLKHSASEPSVPESRGPEGGVRRREERLGGNKQAPVLRLKAVKRLLKGAGAQTNDTQDKTTGGVKLILPPHSSPKTKSALGYLGNFRKSDINGAVNKKFAIAKQKAKSLPRKLEEGSGIRRRNTAKAELYRCPSIEKLDFVPLRKRTNTDIPLTADKKQKVRKSRVSLLQRKSNNTAPTDVIENDLMVVHGAESGLREGGCSILRSGCTPRARSGSDPCVTFKMLEQKVLSRKQTKKWRRDAEIRKTNLPPNKNAGKLNKSASLDLPDIIIQPPSSSGPGESSDVVNNLNLQPTLQKDLIKCDFFLPLTYEDGDS